MYDPIQITRRYLFGTDSPSTTDYNEHIRPVLEQVPPNYFGPPVRPEITFSMSEYMTEGAGRFALPALFPAIQRFFDFFEFDLLLANGTYSYDSISTTLGLTDNDFRLGISQYGTEISGRDFPERAYIFGSTSFRIKNTPALQFTVSIGQRSISGLEIIAETDNFDFETDNGSAGFVNTRFLNPSFNPYGLGRGSLTINYSGEGAKYDNYNIGDYVSDQRSSSNINVIGSFGQTAQDLAGIVALGLRPGTVGVFSDLLSDEFLRYQTPEGRKVVYGTPLRNILDSSDAAFVTSLLPLGYRLVGGGGNDFITGSVLPDELLGGTGNDELSGGLGSDDLNGGDGNDNLDGGASPFGASPDKAIYRGPADEYDISTLSNGAIRISDRVAGRDGTDTLTRVERAQFSDKTVNLTSPGQDIAFVVDTTGSMADAIEEVKLRATEIISAVFDSETGSTKSRIAVVEYNDPYTDTLLSFTDQPNTSDRKSAAIDAIYRLSADGGGDIPELVNAGLLRALDGRAGEWREDASARRIILFGDAPPKDQELREQVLSLAADVGTIVNPLLLVEDVVTSFVSKKLAVTRFAMQATGGTSEKRKLPVEIFTVLIGDDLETAEDFESLAMQTGGEALNASEDSELVDLIISAIEVPTVDSTENGPNPDEGTPNKDEFEGTDDDDFFRSLADDDRLEGRGGNDLLDGGTGNDRLFGGFGDDLLLGGDGNDLLGGDADNDTLYGNIGSDSILGGSGNDLLVGGDGDDAVHGQTGNETLYGEAGSDIVSGGEGNDTLIGYGFSDGEFDILAGDHSGSRPGLEEAFDGADRFVLGSSDGAFYLGDGHALISDFYAGEGDRIEVFGAASDYVLSFQNVTGGSANDTLIRYQGDLIGVVRDVAVSLSADFVFV